MKKTFVTIYLVSSLVICSWYTAAAALGWKAPNFGIANSTSGGSRSGYYGGRAFGGSWGGGK